MNMLDAHSSLSKPLVLVVEDEAALATMMRYNLEKQGFRVEEAADGQEALTRIAESQPDLVLLDWMDGRQKGRPTPEAWPKRQKSEASWRRLRVPSCCQGG